MSVLHCITLIIFHLDPPKLLIYTLIGVLSPAAMPFCLQFSKANVSRMIAYEREWDAKSKTEFHVLQSGRVVMIPLGFNASVSQLPISAILAPKPFDKGTACRIYLNIKRIEKDNSLHVVWYIQSNLHTHHNMIWYAATDSWMVENLMHIKLVSPFSSLHVQFTLELGDVSLKNLRRYWCIKVVVCLPRVLYLLCSR